MQFLLIVVISLVVLGIIAAIASRGSTDEPIVQKEGDCGSCSSRAECKLADLKEDVRKKRDALPRRIQQPIDGGTRSMPAITPISTVRRLS